MRLLGILALCSVSLAFAGEKSMEEYWRDAGLTFKLVEKTFDKAECYKAERAFLACAHGANQALALGKLVLTTKERQQATPSAFGPVKQDWGLIVAVEPKPTAAGGPAAEYEAARKERAAVHQFWTRLYQNRAAAGETDFSTVIGWVKNLPNFGAKEPVLAANVLNTMLGVLQDPHTMVLPLQYVVDQQSATADNFSGIGARFKVVRKNGKSLIVLETPLENSPALKAGLRAHDVLTHIDGQPVSGEDFAAATNKIRGKQGTPVDLTVERNGQAIQITVVRDVIQVPNIASKILTAAGVKLGWVKFGSFMKDKGCESLGQAVTDLVAQGVKALIFDLRDNGGGLMTQAVCVANLFLDKGKVVVTTKSLTGAPDETLKTTTDPLTKLPMVTLINARSASASEIVAGALQDHQRSWIVGVRSYGKGSVQTQRRINPDLAMRSTIARFYLPSGRTNQVEGVLPDFTAWSIPNASDDDKVAYREEDEYMALAPIGTPWKQPRPTEVAAIEACAAKSGKAEATFTQESQTSPILPDYQQLSAADVLSCALAAKHPTSTGFEIGNGRTWFWRMPRMRNFNFAVPGIGVM